MERAFLNVREHESLPFDDECPVWMVSGRVDQVVCFAASCIAGTALLAKQLRHVHCLSTTRLNK